MAIKSFYRVNDASILLMNVQDKMEDVIAILKKGKHKHFYKEKLKNIKEIDNEINLKGYLSFEFNPFEKLMLTTLNDLNKIINVLEEYKAFHKGLNYIEDNLMLKNEIKKSIYIIENEENDEEKIDNLFNLLISELEKKYDIKKVDSILGLNFPEHLSRFSELAEEDAHGYIKQLNLYIPNLKDQTIRKSKYLDIINNIKNRNNYRQAQRLHNYIIDKLGHFTDEEFKEIELKIEKIIKDNK